MPAFSQSLEWSLHRALAAAKERQHEYATVEHLLLALIDDADADTVMRACNVDLEKLRRDLIACIESELEKPVTDGSEDTKPTEDFHRVIQRAVTHVQAVGREKSPTLMCSSPFLPSVRAGQWPSCNNRE